MSELNAQTALGVQNQMLVEQSEDHTYMMMNAKIGFSEIDLTKVAQQFADQLLSGG